MLISQRLRKENIVEYLLYMWQVEDIIRAYGCDLTRIRREYISRFELTDEQREDMTDWYGNLIRMIREEGCSQGGHVQINRLIVQQLMELHSQLMQSPKFPFYNAEYYKVLPFIVELRQKARNAESRKQDAELSDARSMQGEANSACGMQYMELSEIETCLNALYGVMLLRLQRKEISPSTENAVKEIGTFLGMLSDYFQKEKEDPKFWD